MNRLNPATVIGGIIIKKLGKILCAYSNLKAQMGDQSLDDLFAMAAAAAMVTSTVATGTGCEHAFTVEHDGEVFCNDCGEALKDLDTEFRKEKNKTLEDGGRCQSLQSNNGGIMADIRHIHTISQNIKDRAGEYFDEYMRVTNSNVLRQKSRHSVIAAVLYYAYMEEENKVYPIEPLAKMLTVEPRDVSHGLHKVSRSLPHLRSFQITETDIMHQLLRKLGAVDPLDFQWVEYIFSVIENLNSTLNKARMNSVASGIVWYYIQRENKPITLEHFSRVCGLSKSTIANIAGIVETTFLANCDDEEEQTS